MTANRPTIASTNARLDEALGQMFGNTAPQKVATAKVVTDLGTRVATDHDDIVTDVKPRLTALEETTAAMGVKLGTLEEALQAGSTGGRKGFIIQLRESGITDAHIAQLLTILHTDDTALDLSDAELFKELYTAFGATHATVSQHTTDITRLKGRTKNLEDAVGEINEKLSKITTGSQFPWWGWIAAVVVGLIGSLVYASYDFTENGAVTVGSQTGTARLDYSFAESGWAILLVGLGMFFMVLCIVAMFSGKTTSKTTVQRSAQASRQATSESAVEATRTHTTVMPAVSPSVSQQQSV